MTSITRRNALLGGGFSAIAGLLAWTSLGQAMPDRAQAAVATPVAVASTDKPPVVVELFQSQGCSSCPPANANLNALAQRPDVLALSFGVTYWDQLGWTDTFATPQYTERQWEYARSRGRERVWTPQVYVNGKADVVGANRTELDGIIAKARAVRGAPVLSIRNGLVEVGAGTPQKADVWFVRYDPKSVPVAIRAGENGGRTLPHKNIVRELVNLGEWKGGAVSYPVPKQTQNGLASATFLQAAKGGAILTAAKGT